MAENVIIGEGSPIGICAVVIQGINILKWATIGAGSLIIRKIENYTVVVGNPGKTVKFNIER